jgi:hypothetical protein
MLFISWIHFVLLAVINNAKVVVVIITVLFFIMVLSFFMVVVLVAAAAAAAVHSDSFAYQISCSKTLLYSCYCCYCHVLACTETYSMSCVPHLPQNTWWSF